MRLIPVVGVLAILGCASPTLPSIDVFGEVTGTGSGDLWSFEAGALVHWDASVKQRVELPTAAVGGNLKLVPAGPGAVWLISVQAARRIVALKVDGTGAVLSDRSADFEALVPGETYGMLYARGSRGAVFLQIGTSQGQRTYRFDGEKFVLLARPTQFSSLAPVAVRGLDEAWFHRDFLGLVHYQAGTWTEIASSPVPLPYLSFDEAGVGYALSRTLLEVENGTPVRAFLSVLRLENEAASVLRLEVPASGSFVPFGVLARPGGRFAVVGGQQRGGPYTWESLLVARSGDATSVSNTETQLHSFSDTCTAFCNAMGAPLTPLEDGTFLLNGGPQSEKGGAIKVLIGAPASLP